MNPYFLQGDPRARRFPMIPGVPGGSFIPVPGPYNPNAPACPPAYCYPNSALKNCPPPDICPGSDVLFGLDSGAAGITSGTTATLTTTPQKRNTPKRLVVSTVIANNFALSAMSVGVEPVLATTANLSMAVFIQDSLVNPFKASVLDVGMNFSVTVTNITTATQRFLATVVGTDFPSGY